jgi:hypothetical protein
MIKIRHNTSLMVSNTAIDDNTMVTDNVLCILEGSKASSSYMYRENTNADHSTEPRITLHFAESIQT